MCTIITAAVIFSTMQYIQHDYGIAVIQQIKKQEVNAEFQTKFGHLQLSAKIVTKEARVKTFH